MEFEVNGFKCLVDDEDWEWVKELKLEIRKGKKRRAQRYLFSGDASLQRLVFIRHKGFIKPGYVIDHANRKSLDCRSVNLRQLTNIENLCLNRRKIQGSGTSKYIGVSKDKCSKKWKAQYYLDGQHIYLGLHDTEKLAALAYDIFAVTNFSNPLRLNFPEEVIGLKELLC